ncbi:hypothetical protein BS47DRAFT_1346655 [Hydnum rufescens UP504]|uniref:Uncharacterized protein n=1 Tax=Hydnum rufescens UP504 TaxID=1448309 RepID=A0A9P6AT77_9AGAM|nr:hypothetical protein BS47DRAFT_1346655 [Hydnum rufescens UP504]
MAGDFDSGHDTDMNRRLGRAHPGRTSHPPPEFGEYRPVAYEELGSNPAPGAIVSKRSKRYTIACLILDFVIGAWLSYCSIRYLIAAKGYFYKSSVFYAFIATASAILFGICIANVILVSVLRRPTDPAHPDTYARAIQGRCTWDVDAIWTGTGMACGDGMHVWSLYLVAAILRLIITAAVLVLFVYLVRKARSSVSLEKSARPSRPSRVHHTRSSSMMSFFARPRNNTVSSGTASGTVTTALTSPTAESDDHNAVGLSPERERSVSFAFGGHHPWSSVSSGSSRSSSTPVSPVSSLPRSRGHRRSLSIDLPVSPMTSKSIAPPDPPPPVPALHPLIPSPNSPTFLDSPPRSPRGGFRMLRTVDAEYPVSGARTGQRSSPRYPTTGGEGSPRRVRPVVQILGGDVEKMSTIESVSSQDQPRSGRMSRNEGGSSEVESLSSLGQEWNGNERSSRSSSSSSSSPPSPPWTRLAAPGNG